MAQQQQRSNNSTLDLATDEQLDASEIPVQRPVLARRSSVETEAKAEIVRQMQLKRKKLAMNLQLEQTRARVRGRYTNGPHGSTSQSAVERQSSTESSVESVKQKVLKKDDKNSKRVHRKTTPNPMKDPNCVGYIPRRNHRHEHQSIRAKQMVNYSLGIPLNTDTGDSSDEYSRYNS